MELSSATPKKFVVLLAPGVGEASVRQAQKSLGIKMTSSEELGGGVRAQDIYASGSGLVFKNLQVAVVDNLSEEQLLASVRGPGPVLYFEEEQTFRPVQELELLRDLKLSLGMVNQQVEKLATYLENLAEAKLSSARLTWGLRAVGAGKTSLLGRGVKLAVLDSGLQVTHPDFNKRIIQGKSFVPNESWDEDLIGHGTHCTGTIAGEVSSANDIRYGLAPGVELLVGKILDATGGGQTSSILDAIDWAIEKSARIISLSIGAPVKIGAAPSPIFERVGKKALDQNCLIIAAAGNDSRRGSAVPRPVSNPANAQSIMSVGAVDQSLQVASFSNAGINASTGGRIDLVGPGVKVFSSYSGEADNGGEAYASLAGTSMATPHVAAIAAHYLEASPELSAGDLWEKLTTSALALEGQKQRDVGAGLVQTLPG